MNKWLLFGLTFISLACKSKKKERYFPVLSYIKSQVAHVDTSLYKIVQVKTLNGQSDTIFLKREDFKHAAKDFLTLPDIASSKWQDNYQESQLYDQDLKTVVLNYMPKNNEGEIRRQDVIISPNSQQGDEVKTIYIERRVQAGKDEVQKKMTWEVNKRFKITSIMHHENGTEEIETAEVIWNDQ